MRNRVCLRCRDCRIPLAFLRPRPYQIEVNVEAVHGVKIKAGERVLLQCKKCGRWLVWDRLPHSIEE